MALVVLAAIAHGVSSLQQTPQLRATQSISDDDALVPPPAQAAVPPPLNDGPCTKEGSKSSTLDGAEPCQYKGKGAPTATDAAALQPGVLAVPLPKGEQSTQLGANTEASGESSTALGSKTFARGKFSTAMGWSTHAMGQYSTALGRNTDATGAFSTSMGHATEAAGDNSLAMGFGSKATGDYSTAMGHSTRAAWGYATSMGFQTTASGEASTSMGRNTSASGQHSLATGGHTQALGEAATAFGRYSISTAEVSTAMGHMTAATSFYATALGAYTTASGDCSTAMGHGTTASGIHSTAMGKMSTASGSFSTAMGRGTHASGAYAIASGRLSKAEGDFSTAMGYDTTAQSHGEVVLGQYNELFSPSKSQDSPSVKGWSKHDAAFRVGVGTGEADRKDALTVYKDGRVCTADGKVSKCGEEDGLEAQARREREAALPGQVDELQTNMAELKGRDTQTAGSHAVASGEGSAAEGALSSAMGYYTTAQSYAEVVLGRYNELYTGRYEDSPAAKGWNKHDAVLRVGVGTGEDDRKDALTVFKDGRVCTAEGMVGRCGEEQFEAETRRDREAALPGQVDELQGKVAAIMGRETKVTGSHAVASGQGGAAEGALSSAMGYYTTAQTYAEVVLGRYNQLATSRFDDSPNSHGWTRHDAVLRVGIGSSEADRKDALTVYKDGRVCTADGFVSKCGDTNEGAAERDELQKASVDKEAAKDALVEELRGEVQSLKADVAQMEALKTDVAQMKASMSQMSETLVRLQTPR